MLFVNQKLRIANDVDEQNMRDLQRDLSFDLGRHVPMRLIHILRCPVEELKIDNHASQGVAHVQRPFQHLSLCGNLTEKARLSSQKDLETCVRCPG